MNQDEFAVDWLDKNGFSSVLDAAVSAWKTKNGITNGNSYINMMLQEMGYATLDAYRAEIRASYESGFEPTTYDYQFTADNFLLAQEKLPANKGSNELQGKTFTYGDDNEDISYTFTSNTYTYTRTTTWSGTPETTTITGTYAYDSAAKQVWLRSEKINGKTMPEYYESYSGNAADKAGDFNYFGNISIPVLMISFTKGLSLFSSDVGNALGSRQICLL